jgi:hypothetical protein
MANARAKGRPIAAFELSAEERAYLERQVRRYRVTRSLSERCRIICDVRTDCPASWSRPSSAYTSTPLANGGDAS